MGILDGKFNAAKERHAKLPRGFLSKVHGGQPSRAVVNRAAKEIKTRRENERLKKRPNP